VSKVELFGTSVLGKNLHHGGPCCVLVRGGGGNLSYIGFGLGDDLGRSDCGLGIRTLKSGTTMCH
jgi:hypothetical protein